MRFLIWLVILWGAASRVIWLDCLPGINGDEALVPVQAYRWANGLPAAWLLGSRPQVGPCLWFFGVLFGWTHTTEFWYLRVPSVLGSVVSCFVVWRGWGKLLGPAAPWVALLLWSMPVEIIYARFGWDPSLMSMSISLLGAALLGGRLLWIVLAVAFGLANHPFFLVTLAIIPLITSARLKPQWLGYLMFATQFGGWLAILFPYVRGRALGAIEPWKVDFPRFCAGLPEILSGRAAMASLVDPVQHPLGTWADYIIGILLAAALNWLPWVDLKRKRLLSAALGASIWLALGGLFFGLGTQAVVSPGDRNGLMLIVPLVVWLVLRLSFLMSQRTLQKLLLVLSLAGLSWCASDYFYSLRVYGNRSNRSFMCAAEEPHRTAFRQATLWLAPGAVIVTDDWHNFQDMAYLALPYGIPVFNVQNKQFANLRDDLLAGCVVVTHSYSPVMQAVLELNLPLRRITISQAGGREVLDVFALAPPDPSKH